MLCTQHRLYTTPQVQHVQHVQHRHNGSTSHGETTLSLAGNLASRGNILRALQFHLDWRKKAKESEKAQGKIWISNYSWISLELLSCVYDFLVSFGIHGTCIQFLSYVLSLAWRIPWIDSGLSLCHFLDIHGVVGFPLDCFIIVAHALMVVL